MTLPTRASILRLNQTVGGQPAILVRAKGKTKINMNSINGGQIVFARGLGYDGNINVSGTWKAFTNGFINVNGTWKELDELNSNISGTWKQ